MKNRIIIAAAFAACLALCAAVWTQTEKVEKTPTPSETTAVTTPRPTPPETEERVLPAIVEKQESGIPEAESAPEGAAEELPIPAPEIEDEPVAEQKSALRKWEFRSEIWIFNRQIEAVVLELTCISIYSDTRCYDDDLL